MADTIYAKLVEIQRDLHAPKDLRNTFAGYNYRSAESILEALKPHLKQHGLVLTISDELVHFPTTHPSQVFDLKDSKGKDIKEVVDGDRFYIKATATLTDGETSISASAYAREAGNKKGSDDAQITGATSSYARKYALNGLFAIDDNKDADTDEHTRQRQQAPEPEPQVPRDHSNDAAWQINYDDLVKAIEQQVPEIDGHAVVKVMARIKNNNDPDPKHLLAKDLGGMIEFAKSDKFVPYYTETITPYLAGEK